MRVAETEFECKLICGNRGLACKLIVKVDSVSVINLFAFNTILVIIPNIIKDALTEIIDIKLIVLFLKTPFIPCLMLYKKLDNIFIHFPLCVFNYFSIF